ncbi:MAG: hypothetical protein AB7F86_08220 [Bdellovibrionales bacterium]
MLRKILIKMAGLAVIWSLQVHGAGRVQTKLPVYDLRQMVTRYSAGAAGRATIGRLVDGQFRPVETYSLGALGTTDCGHLLDRAQAFPLEGMLKAKYIDQEVYDALVSSAKYLRADQVTFFSVLSYLSAEEFAAHREIISDAQLGNAPPRSRQDLTSVSVTVGSAYLVAGFRATPQGLQSAPLPWTKDPVFAPFAEKILAEGGGLNFEVGRAMQVVAGTLDPNLNAAMITIANEMAIHKGDFNKARVFVHSYKKANTLLYQRKFPTMQVVATDPSNPENVVMATSLTGLFSPDRPWKFSGPIQSLVAVNPQVITVPKAWNFLTALRTAGSVAFDYFSKKGERGPSPLVLRLTGPIYSHIVSAQTSSMGITSQKEADAIVNQLNSGIMMTEDFPAANYVDPVLFKKLPSLESLSDVIRISNLDPKESKADADYELRVLIGGVMQYGEILRLSGLQGIQQARYALTTTNPEIAAKLEKLKPSESHADPVSIDWSLKDDPKGATFNFMQATARSYIFTFADVERLAKLRPDLFHEAQERPALRFGDFHREALLSRPTGF